MNQPDVRQFLCVTHKIFFKCPYCTVAVAPNCVLNSVVYLDLHGSGQK